MRTSPHPPKPRTFRSGPYLNKLFLAAGHMDEDLQRAICARIRQARIEAGFTLQDAADALDVTLRAYQNYEKDRVPFRRLAEIAALFAVGQDWLLRGEEAKPPASSDDRIAHLESQLAEALSILRRLEPPSEERVA